MCWSLLSSYLLVMSSSPAISTLSDDVTLVAVEVLAPPKLANSTNQGSGFFSSLLPLHSLSVSVSLSVFQAQAMHPPGPKKLSGATAQHCTAPITARGCYSLLTFIFILILLSSRKFPLRAYLSHFSNLPNPHV